MRFILVTGGTLLASVLVVSGINSIVSPSRVTVGSIATHFNTCETCNGNTVGVGRLRCEELDALRLKLFGTVDNASFQPAARNFRDVRDMASK